MCPKAFLCQYSQGPPIPFAAQVLQALLHQALTEREILKIVTLELPGSREKCRQITRPVLPAKRPLKYIVFEEPYVDTGLTPESVSFLVTHFRGVHEDTG